MSERALAVANYVIKSTNFRINNLHLQKLLYYLQANYIVENEGDPLFVDSIEKWKLGPVVPTVYHIFKDFGPNNIAHTYEDSTVEFKEGVFIFTKNEINLDSEKTLFIDRILPSLLNYDKFELVNLTHGHPMWKNDEERIIKGFKHIKYSNEELYDFFIENPEELLVH